MKRVKMEPTPENKPGFSPARPEREHEGPIWKHPYMIYVVITAGLFLFLVVVGALALQNDWIPKR